jgi:hypothetical protein
MDSHSIKRIMAALAAVCSAVVAMLALISRHQPKVEASTVARAKAVKHAAFLAGKEAAYTNSRAEIERKAPGLFDTIQNSAVEDAKILFGKASPDVRALAFKVHLLGQNIDQWTDGQIDYLSDAIDAIAFLHYDNVKHPEEELIHRRLAEGLNANFTHKDADGFPIYEDRGRVFTQLGNPMLFQKLKIGAKANAPFCTCATSFGGWDDFCNTWGKPVQGGTTEYVCYAGASNCQGGNWGCGILWSAYCSGMCTLAQNAAPVQNTPMNFAAIRWADGSTSLLRLAA